MTDPMWAPYWFAVAAMDLAVGTAAFISGPAVVGIVFYIGGLSAALMFVWTLAKDNFR